MQEPDEAGGGYRSLGLLKDNDEDITIFQGNRYPQLRSAKLPLHSESDDLKGGNNAGVRSTR